MKKRFDSKIKELEKEKTEWDIDFLKTKEKEYQERINNILENQTDIENENAKEKLNELRIYHKRIKDINYKIVHNDEALEHIKKKIDKYKEGKERIESLPLYRETSEWIAELLWKDSLYFKLYKYAENNNIEIAKKLKNRKLTYEEYTKYMEKMYSNIFKKALKNKNNKIEQPTKPRISLPEWVKERIEKNLAWNKDFKPEEIGDFLKKELKKNGWEIKVSHIKNKFKERADKAKDLLKEIISDFPIFKIIDNDEKKNNTTTSQRSKNDKLVASITSSVKKSREKEDMKLLNKLIKTWEEINLKDRIKGYTEILEKLWQKFADKNQFIEETKESIETHTSINIEEGLKNALKKMIIWTQGPNKKNAHWYRAYELWQSYDNRRIILYPNKEIMKICSHTEYENIIDSRPPTDKR